MPIAERLRELLEKRDAAHEVLEHPKAFTAQEEAAVTHTPGRNWAKTVAVRLDGDPALLTLPAHRRVNLDRLIEATGCGETELLTEEEMTRLYPDCETGAMPPFGHLYDQEIFVDESLREDEYIVFHAGDHRTAVKMPYGVYEELAEPVPLFFSEEASV